MAESSWADPIPKAQFLDPRPSELACLHPIRNAVNIPVDQIEERVAELPAKGEQVCIAATQPFAEEMQACLTNTGRQSILADRFELGENTKRFRLWSPNEWLYKYLRREPPVGIAVDLGCGTGRDSVYLAANGFRVTAIDRLPDGLERGKLLAQRYLDPGAQRTIQWRDDNLLAAAFKPEQRFDLIVCCFLFDRDLMQRAKTWLSSQGVLLIEAFTEKRREREGKPQSPERVVKVEEMRDLLSDMEMICYEEGDHVRGHTVRAIATKG